MFSESTAVISHTGLAELLRSIKLVTPKPIGLGQCRSASSRTAVGDRPLLERGWRYTLVDALCAVAHNAIMIAADQAGIHYLLDTVISFLGVTPLGYLLHSRFTFAEPLRLKAFMRFVGGVAAAHWAILPRLYLRGR